MTNQRFRKGTCVSNDLLGICFKFWFGDLEKGGSDSSDGLKKVAMVNYYYSISDSRETDIVVGATLASREDSIINALFKIRGVLEVFPEEDETGTRTTKSLVTIKKWC